MSDIAELGFGVNEEYIFNPFRLQRSCFNTSSRRSRRSVDMKSDDDSSSFVEYPDRHGRTRYFDKPFLPNPEYHNLVIKFHMVRAETPKSYLLQLEPGKSDGIWVPKKLARFNGDEVTINKKCFTLTKCS